MLHLVPPSLPWVAWSAIVLLHAHEGQGAAGGEVIFWVTSEQGVCRWNNGEDVIEDARIISNGGVCAYQEDTYRVFGCPAPDPTCWAWEQNCLGGAYTAGEGQIFCSNDHISNPTSWCCLEGESCPLSINSINICIGAFDNPVAGMQLDAAASFDSSVLGTTTVGTARESANPQPFSTTTASSVVFQGATSSVTTSAAGSSGLQTSASSTPSSSILPSSLTPSETGVINLPTQKSSSSLSKGAIAGIAIGVVIVLAIVATAFFILGRGRKRRLSPVSTVPPVSVVAESHHPKFSAAIYEADAEQVHEKDGIVRAELPASQRR